mmetsp:Transcript_53999/g.126184  ORF Transcript_53999/g.126184 Transcript_53999/m.126184 type:complete len:347 (+) Transcript_53999:300-1340(+)
MSGGSAMGVASYPSANSSTVVEYQHPLEDKALTALAGAVAGICAAFTVCPLDVVKTRLQGQDNRPGQPLKYNGTIRTLVKIASEEGIRGCYRGLCPTLLGMVPTWTTYFTSYNTIKGYLELWGHQRHRAFQGQTVLHMVSACGAGVMTATVTNPFWVVKTRIQASCVETCAYTGTLDAFSKIVRTEGIRGLYRGLGPSLLGVSHITIQYPLYERFKLELAARQGLHCSRTGKSGHDKLGVPSLVLSAASSKITASLFTYPHEVVRTRMMIERRHARMLPVYGLLWKEEGIRGLYRAFFTNVFRVVPSAAVTFVSYELVNDWLQTVHGKGAVPAASDCATAQPPTHH